MNNYVKISINNNVKISAGPGAGKTTYLVNHIKKVVKKSPVLKKARKVACITYTNAAAESIQDKLDFKSDTVEVSTIHSFLYKNVLKPFWELVPDELGIDVRNVDGHDEIYISKGLIYQWKRNTNQYGQLDNDQQIIEAFLGLAWQFNKDNELELKPVKLYKGKIGNYFIRSGSYLEYKKLYWKKGHLAHEDVLYLAYRLIKENKGILRFIKAKFPYLFIDEFQDTSPLQYQILTEFANTGIITGVIGDWGQSIYKFQGAVPELFQSIELEDMKEKTIESNYRCSPNIVNLLNDIRADINQKCDSNIDPGHLIIIVGDKYQAIDFVESLIGEKPTVLTRRNKETNLINNEYQEGAVSDYSLNENLNVDSDSKRRRAILRTIKSIIYAKNDQFKDAIRQIEKVIGATISDSIEKKKSALSVLKKLFQDYDDVIDQNLTDFRDRIDELYTIDLTGLSHGQAKEFYDQHTVKDVIISVERSESNDIAQTIHQAKGLEFESVLLILGADDFDEEKELGFLLEPDLENNEEHRVRYVGISRAIQNLFINIPSLTDNAEEMLVELGFSIEKL